MKKRIWLSLLLVAVLVVAALWVFSNYWSSSSKVGFYIVSLKDNSILLSDSDVLSYNLTSYEIAFTDSASQRLKQLGDSLYSYSPGVSVRINGEEIYQGVFRLAIMSAVPSPPKIAILFPSMLFPSNAENDHALRLFYPSFQPPSDLSQQDAKFVHYFESVHKVVS